MKEVPVPFPYVQLNAFLLNVFSCLLCPIAIASFTSVIWLSVLTTVVTVISFYSVFIVANELEDPFGTEVNDMPMIEYHEEVSAPSLRDLVGRTQTVFASLAHLLAHFPLSSAIRPTLKSCQFCASLCALITNAWLPEDQWLVKEGNWIKPRNVAIGLNAFMGKIGKRGMQVSRKGGGRVPMPYNTLLNRAKANRSRPTPSIFGSSKAKPKHQFPGVVIAHDQNEKAMVIQRMARQNILGKSSPSTPMLKKTATNLREQQLKLEAAGAEAAAGPAAAGASEPAAS